MRVPKISSSTLLNVFWPTTNLCNWRWLYVAESCSKKMSKMHKIVKWVTQPAQAWSQNSDDMLCTAGNVTKVFSWSRYFAATWIWIVEGTKGSENCCVAHLWLLEQELASFMTLTCEESPSDWCTNILHNLEKSTIDCDRLQVTRKIHCGCL